MNTHEMEGYYLKKKLMVIYLLRLIDIILYEKSGDSGGLSRLEE